MRLTNDMRIAILNKALNNVPTIDYRALLIPIIQDALCKHMPPEVRAAYDNEDTREYLHSFDVVVRKGNGYNLNAMTMHHKFYGMTENTGRLEIRMNPEIVERLQKHTLVHTVTLAITKSGYFDKHIAQTDLFQSVKKRLRDTLDSVTTLKRLYDVLEPELHHLIPKEGDKTANLPATVAPVVDDLRKLGAVLPEVQKAATK